MRVTLALVLALSAVSIAAQDDTEAPTERAIALDLDSEAENCIRTSSIRRTRVIDDSTIAFYMRNREVYVNLLPSRCPQLARNNRFAYETRGGRLCSTDTITVLVQFAGRLEPGFTCRLGAYHPSDAESVEIMLEAVEQGGRASSVTAESVELPAEEDGDSEPESPEP
ncbi:MAG: DUF6491 family protein [Gammaproteobacteria bacterium]|jgi:hypothetical protein